MSGKLGLNCFQLELEQWINIDNHKPTQSVSMKRKGRRSQTTIEMVLGGGKKPENPKEIHTGTPNRIYENLLVRLFIF